MFPSIRECSSVSWENKEMLRSIKKDGIRWLCARGVIVSYDGDGFSMEVDKEEYGYYFSEKEILPDIEEFQKDRPFPLKEMLV